MNLSAVLLAGGESRRMGQDKATLTFDRLPLWQRQLDVLRQINPIEILISARVEPAWRPTDTTFVPDIPPSRGPLSGLIAAITIMRGSHLLALAVDMPRMTTVQLELLCKVASGNRGAVPTIGVRTEPLAAIYPTGALPFLSAAMESRDYSLQNVVQKLANAGLISIVELPESEMNFYRSMNTPDDLDMDRRFSSAPIEAPTNF